MLVSNSFGQAAQEAQVFSLEAAGPRGSVEPKFHGFSSPAGVFPLAGIAAGSPLFVLGSDGSTGQITIPDGLVALVTVPLVPTGRVMLGEHLRPTGSAAGDIVTLRFEFRGSSTAGMRPVAVRFFSAATAWEVSGLPAGEYRTVINNTVREFVVPAGGFIILE